jgi:hypothetical protein
MKRACRVLVAYPFGETVNAAFFPEIHPPAVRVPESFRGGCSFGDDDRHLSRWDHLYDSGK